MYTTKLIKAYVVLLLNINTVPKVQSQAIKKGLGISACTYNGKPNSSYNCNDTFVPIENLPDICTSFIYEIVYVNATYHLNDLYHNEEYLDELLRCKHDVFLYYGHVNQEWSQVLDGNIDDGGVKATEEMESLQVYLDQHEGIKGIILVNLIPGDESPGIQNYTQNLKVYIDVMSNTFPDLAIGIDLYGISLKLYYSSQIIEELDFNIIDPIVDFYVLNLVGIEQCTDELRNTGPVPSTGDAQYTMENMFSYLKMTNIPTSKIHYFFKLSATTMELGITCDLTYTKICTDPNATNAWCADTQQSFREKGQFARVNGAGFIAAHIDLNDPSCDCECGFPFPAFHFLLDGFNGVTTPVSCPLFDRL